MSLSHASHSIRQTFNARDELLHLWCLDVYKRQAIYDATGTLIRSLEGAGRADLSELPAGLYVVTGVAADSTSASAAMTIVKE